MSALLRGGKSVLIPVVDDQRYDLVIDEGNKFSRIQCKLGKLVRGAVSFRTHSFNASSGRRDYRGDVDYFGVYCAELGTCYLIPVEDVPLRIAYLRISPSRNNQSLRIRWANDYLIP